MKYTVFLLCFLLTHGSYAQSDLTGLGTYTLGRTTPDSLDRSAFTELSQAYVKGTIALPCNHIRTFKAAQTTVENVDVNDLLLFFYDNVLFRISCTYTDSLRQLFVRQHGKGRAQPKGRFTFCPQYTTQPMLIDGEIWQQGDSQAVAAYAKGYNADCQQIVINQLLIKSQQIMDLASDCELPTTNPYADEFDKGLNDR